MTPETTDDALGAVRLRQHRHGYRFTLDAPMLAAFVLDGRERRTDQRVVELGTGCGVIALLLKSQRPRWNISALELQPALANLARENAQTNDLDVTVIEGDLRTPPVDWRGRFDRVVCNPPYFAAHAGHVSPFDERALARHDTTATPADLARSLRRLLHDDGAGLLVYPAPRLDELTAALHTERLSFVRLRVVHATPTDDAHLALVECRPLKRRPLIIAPPLIVHDGPGQYTAEIQQMLARFDTPAPAVSTAAGLAVR